jgi:thiamine biosynthesis lipoprotein
MAGPCQVLLESADPTIARRVFETVEREALRIEKKYSRYRETSLIARIHASRGRSIELDDETAGLLDFAAQAFQLSDGAFDITSGVLRRLWPFGSDTESAPGAASAALRPPDPAAIAAIRAQIGWQRVTWQRPHLLLPPGMEIDLGGIAKEYAVDRALALANQLTDAPLLINFGGDLRVSGLRGCADTPHRPWRVAIESVAAAGAPDQLLALHQGALATSGDTHRYLEIDGKRYGHILDPRRAAPVDCAPRSVTVLAPTCMEAGILATLAMLQGAGAEAFLDAQQVRSWCRW